MNQPRDAGIARACMQRMHGGRGRTVDVEGGPAVHAVEAGELVEAVAKVVRDSGGCAAAKDVKDDLVPDVRAADGVHHADALVVAQRERAVVGDGRVVDVGDHVVLPQHRLCRGQRADPLHHGPRLLLRQLHACVWRASVGICGGGPERDAAASGRRGSVRPQTSTHSG